MTKDDWHVDFHGFLALYLKIYACILTYLSKGGFKHLTNPHGKVIVWKRISFLKAESFNEKSPMH